MRLSNKESDILKACLQWLHLKGVWCWRQNNMPARLPNGGYRRFVGLKGVSDILGILTRRVFAIGHLSASFGVLLAVEIKQPGKKPTDDQAEFLAQVNKRGGVGVCVHSLAELEVAMKPYLGGSK